MLFRIFARVKTRINVSRGLAQSALIEAALADEKVAELLKDKEIRKQIAVPDRLVNFVAS